MVCSVYPFYDNNLCYFYCRGKQFRAEFFHISEIRSILPSATNVMALTATANLKTREIVVRCLDMKGCFILSHNPNKVNIYYEVTRKTDLESVIQPIVEHVCQNKTESDHHLIFCRSLSDCLKFLR